MKVNENVLKDVLIEALADYNNKNKNYEEIFKETMFDMYNIKSGKAMDIFNGKLPVDLMNRDLLFKLTKVLYKLNSRTDATFDKEKLDVNLYFFENEISEYDVKLINDAQPKEIIIEDGDWIKVSDDQYIIKVYPSKLESDFLASNRLNYNPETQRDLTLKETKTGIVKIITFFKSAYESICRYMESGMYIPNMLALNINPDYNELPRVIKGNLIIPESAKIDCIDGYHRLRAAITTRRRNPNWEQPLLFFLFTVDAQKASSYILQEDFKNHLSKKQVEKSDTSDAANFIVKKLADSANFHLRNSLINDEEKLSNVSDLIRIIYNPEKLFTQEARQKAILLYKKIEKNINEFIEEEMLFSEEFSKEKWFLCLYVLKHCEDYEVNFLSTIRTLYNPKLLEEINFINKPTKANYEKIKGALKYV